MVDVWDVRTQLLNYFHSHPGENVRTVDLCRVIKQPKKTINSVLYRLQRDGVLQKVVESPPTWREAGSGSRIEQQYSIGYPNDGAAVSSFKLVPIASLPSLTTLRSPTALGVRPRGFALAKFAAAFVW